MNNLDKKRREFVKQVGLGTAASLALGGSLISACGSAAKSEASTAAVAATKPANDFKISLAQWSLHRAFFNKELDVMDYPSIAKSYGIDGIELVNQFYKGKATDQAFLSEYKQRCADAGVNLLLVMCDGLGYLGDADAAKRMEAVENHYQWIDAVKYWGGHSIRVNAAGKGTAEEVAGNAIDGLGKLTEYGQKAGINVIVENHGGYSSDGKWLANVIGSVASPFCGTLPDFGNFCIERGENGCEVEYDRYKGMKDLMPYAKGVSAKSHDFDSRGNEVNTDFKKVMSIVKESGYQGYVGIEYEGSVLSEPEGIKATKALLEKTFNEV